MCYTSTAGISVAEKKKVSDLYQILLKNDVTRQWNLRGARADVHANDGDAPWHALELRRLRGKWYSFAYTIRNKHMFDFNHVDLLCFNKTLG